MIRKSGTGFPKRSCSNKKIERDDDSKKGHPALVGREHRRSCSCKLWSSVMENFTPLSAAIGGGLIGLSAVLLMLLTGRIAGISGIFGGLLDFANDDKGWRIAFIAGLILAPLMAGGIGHAMPTPKLPASRSVVIAAVQPFHRGNSHLHADGVRDGCGHPSPVGRLRHADDRVVGMRIDIRCGSA